MDRAQHVKQRMIEAARAGDARAFVAARAELEVLESRADQEVSLWAMAGPSRDLRHNVEGFQHTAGGGKLWIPPEQVKNVAKRLMTERVWRGMVREGDTKRARARELAREATERRRVAAMLATRGRPLHTPELVKFDPRLHPRDRRGRFREV